MSDGGVIPALVIVISLKREKGEPFRRQGKKLVMEKELMQLRFNDAIFSELFLAIQNIYLWSLTPVLRNYMNIAEVQIKKTCP